MRQRPAKLSNRNCCYSDEQIRKIDRKEESQLDWRDFDAIFAISGCTATYDEQVYYLPGALTYLIEHPSEGAEFVADIAYFLSKEAGRLTEENLLAPSIDALWRAFRAWTSEFAVVHFDEAACRAKGWRLDHGDYVENSDSLRELIDVLLRYHTHAHVAEEMVASWLRPDRRAEDSAWLLEFAKEQRHAYEFFSREYPGKDRETTPTRFSTIYPIISDTSLLRDEFARIRDTLVARTPSPTYWPDLLKALSLE